MSDRDNENITVCFVNNFPLRYHHAKDELSIQLLQKCEKRPVRTKKHDVLLCDNLILTNRMRIELNH